jgi:hypothetical protein
MMRRGRVVRSLYILAALISTVSGAADEAVQVELGRPQLVLDASLTRSPYLVGFKLSFDARFANQSKTPVDIPDLDQLRGAVAGIGLNGLESQQSDGSWRFIVPGGMLAWKGDTVFADCRSLGPNETAEVKGASHPLAVYKSNLGGLGPKATLRLTLILSCKRRDGEVALKYVLTNPFVLSIPPLP